MSERREHRSHGGRFMVNAGPVSDYEVLLILHVNIKIVLLNWQ